MQVDSTQPSRCEDRFFGQDRVDLPSRLVQDVGADTRGRPVDIERFERMVRDREKIDRRRSGDQCDPRMGSDPFDKDALDGGSSLILPV